MFARIVVASGIAASIAAVLALAPRGFTQTIPVQPPQTPQGISVVGEGIVLAQPNVVRITLGVDIFDQSLSNAQTQAAQRMDAVVSKLKAAGIPEGNIRTVTYNVTPQYEQQGGGGQPALRGYQVQNMVEVKSTNVGGLGSLLDDVVSAGATRIFGIAFEADDPAALKNQARDQAMTNAHAKAEQLARDAGVSLGRPITIEESDVGGVTPVRQLNAAPAAAAAPATPIQPGQLQVTTTVRVIWSIQ